MAGPKKRGAQAPVSSNPQGAVVGAVATDFTPIQKATKHVADLVRAETEEIQAKAATERASDDLNQMVAAGQSAKDIKPAYSYGTIAGVKAYNKATNTIHASLLTDEMTTEITSIAQNGFFGGVDEHGNPTPPLSTIAIQKKIATTIEDMQTRINSSFGGDVPTEMSLAVTEIISNSRGILDKYQLSSEAKTRDTTVIQYRRIVKREAARLERRMTDTVNIENGLAGNRVPAAEVQGDLDELRSLVADKKLALDEGVKGDTVAARDARAQKEVLDGLLDNYEHAFTGTDGELLGEDGSLSMNRAFALKVAVKLLGSPIPGDDVARQVDQLNNHFAKKLVDAALSEASLSSDPSVYLNAHNQIARDLLSNEFFDIDRKLMKGLHEQVRASAGKRAAQLGVYPLKAIDQLLAGDLRTEALDPLVAAAAEVPWKSNAAQPDNFDRVYNWTGSLDVHAQKDTIFSNGEANPGVRAAYRATYNFQKDINSALAQDNPDPSGAFAALADRSTAFRNEVEKMPTVGPGKELRKRFLDRADELIKFVNAPHSEEFASMKQVQSVLGKNSGVGVGEFNLASMLRDAASGAISADEFSSQFRQNVKDVSWPMIQMGKVLNPNLVGIAPDAQAEMKSMFTTLFNSDKVEDVEMALQILRGLNGAYVDMGHPTVTAHLWESTELNKVAPGAVVVASALDNGLDSQVAATMMMRANLARKHEKATFTVKGDPDQEKHRFEDRNEQQIAELLGIVKVDELFSLDEDVANIVTWMDVAGGGRADGDALDFANDAINGYYLEQADKGIAPDKVDQIPLRGIGEVAQKSTEGWVMMDNGQAIKLGSNMEAKIVASGETVEGALTAMNDAVSIAFIGGLGDDSATLLQLDKATFAPAPGGRYQILAPSKGTWGLLYPVTYKDTGQPIYIDPVVAAKNKDAIGKKIAGSDTSQLKTSWRDLWEGVPGDARAIDGPVQ